MRRAVALLLLLALSACIGTPADHTADVTASATGSVQVTEPSDPNIKQFIQANGGRITVRCALNQEGTYDYELAGTGLGKGEFDMSAPYRGGSGAIIDGEINPILDENGQPVRDQNGEIALSATSLRNISGGERVTIRVATTTFNRTLEFERCEQI
ncbi:MAG TPA: hypothetical protein VD907_06125 [Verrucomicrobiae bacterium]|nr:hypothetical protein [Verrucomicrobiae bacterium]